MTNIICGLPRMKSSVSSRNSRTRAGRISLKNAKDEERTDVGRFLGRSFRDKDISFSVKEFEEALRSSRFADVDITELIEGYLGRRIVSNREL